MSTLKDVLISYFYKEKWISSRLFLCSCHRNDHKPDATSHLEPNTTRFVAVAAKTIRFFFFFLPRQTGKERSLFQRTIPHMTWNDLMIMQKALGSAGDHLSCGRRRTHVHVMCVSYEPANSYKIHMRSDSNNFLRNVALNFTQEWKLAERRTVKLIGNLRRRCWGFKK